MKKTSKTCLILIILVVFICLAALLAMFLLRICPPTGPWPVPPWCENLPTSALQTAPKGEGVQLFPTATGKTQLLTPNPYPVENTWGYVAPTANAAPGSPIEVTFTVVLPVTEGEVSLQANGASYPMTSDNGYLFTSKPLPFKSGEPIRYFYNSNGRETTQQNVTPNSDFTVMDGLNWSDTEKIVKTSFVKGFGIMDFGGFNVSELRGGRLPSTLASMQTNGAEWYMYDYYWSYTDYTLPEIVDEAQFPKMQYPTAEDLKTMAEQVHGQGMKFILLLSLEWSAIPGNPCYQFHGDSDKLAECSNNYWLEGREYEKTMLKRLTDNPNDPEALAYRDEWFNQYKNFLLYAAGLAEENGIEMIVIGKNTAFAHSKIHEVQWRDLIAAVREVYKGHISSIFECYNDACLSDQPWVDAVDSAMLSYWFTISTADTPTRGDIAAEMQRINRSVVSPFYQTYHKPVFFTTPFMSRDHPARQEWVEPASSAPAVGRDLEGQAELYELFFETSVKEEWFAGVVPYGYWFFDGFHPDFAFDRAYSVRNKPAGLVLRSWFDRIQAQ